MPLAPDPTQRPRKQPRKPIINLTATEPTELMAFLLANLPGKNRNNIKTLLADGQIRVGERLVKHYNHPLQPGDAVAVMPEKMLPATHYRGIAIFYEDEHIMVIEKPEGLLSMGTNKEREQTAYAILKEHVKRANPANKIFIVHRLDRDTSGLMMFAKSEKVQQLLQETWGPTTKERLYVALVEGVLPEPTGTIESYLFESKALIVYSTNDTEAGQLAITHYETLRSNRYYTLLKVSLETGRKNQVRVHLSEQGYPIVGDKKYGATSNPIGRLGLHAWVLNFTHPITHEPMKFETAVPSKFLRVF
jgi:23S rRNA pseudouridine1911/1915/1917 synthase